MQCELCNAVKIAVQSTVYLRVQFPVCLAAYNAVSSVVFIAALSVGLIQIQVYIEQIRVFFSTIYSY